MAHTISKRELDILERDRRENCRDEGYRYIHGRHVGDGVVSDRQKRKAERDTRNNKLKKGTKLSQILPDSIEARVSGRQRPVATVRSATSAAISPAASKPVFHKQPGESTSTKYNATATASTHAKVFEDIKAVRIGNICVKLNSDDLIYSINSITGSALLPDNKLILVDWNNHKVKLVDLQTSKVTEELKMPSAPWDITSINGDLVAVTLPHSRKIVFIKVMDQLRLDRDLLVDRYCRAIIHINGELIVSYVDPSKIEIMSLDGTAKRKIANSELFQWPEHMSLSKDETVVYVSDFCGNSVKRLSLDGVVEATYEDKELCQPLGIVRVDQKDRLLVCGHNSNNIHLLEPDLTQVKVIPLQEEHVARPCSLTYCHSTRKLYVGMWKSDTGDGINVFELLLELNEK